MINNFFSLAIIFLLNLLPFNLCSAEINKKVTIKMAVILPKDGTEMLETARKDILNKRKIKLNSKYIGEACRVMRILF